GRRVGTVRDADTRALSWRSGHASRAGRYWRVGIARRASNVVGWEEEEMRPFHRTRVLVGFVLIGGTYANPSPQPPASWRLVVNHTLGVGADDRSIFTDIRGLAINKRGDVFVLDVESQDIRMFDPRGQFVKV